MDADAPELGLTQLSATLVVTSEHLVGATERLDDADAARRFFDHRREVAGLVLDVADHDVVSDLETAAQQQHGNRGGNCEQPEPDIQVHEQREDREHLDDHDHEEDGAERGEASDQRDVRVRARQQLARLPVIVEADLEPLKMLVEVVAQAGLDAGRDFRQCESAAVCQRELEDREPEREHEEGHKTGLVAVVDRSVDRRRGDQRDRELGADRQHGGDRDEDDAAHMGPEVGADPPQCSLAHARSWTRRKIEATTAGRRERSIFRAAAAARQSAVSGRRLLGEFRK